MERVQIGKGTFAGIMEGGQLVKVAQETWDKKGFDTVILSKEEILKLAEMIKSESEEVTSSQIEYKVFVWSLADGKYIAASTALRNLADVQAVLDRCERNRVVNGMDWDTTDYKIKKRTVTRGEWEWDMGGE